MIVGLTYDLRSRYLAEGFTDEETAEFDRGDTLDSIQGALEQGGYRTRRIGNVRELTVFLAGGGHIDIVFNIAEGMYGMAREAQVPALLEAWNIPCTFSDPVTLALTHHKGLAKTVAAAAGVPTPPFTVLEQESDIESVTLPFPLFIKPVAEGTGKGITSHSLVTNRCELEEQALRLLRKFRQPALVEQWVGGREFTVGILGSGSNAHSVGVLEIALKAREHPQIYCYHHKEHCEELVTYTLVNDTQARGAAQVAVQAWRALGGRDCGRVDIRCSNDGAPFFLEVNPLPGLHPHHSDLPMLWTAGGRRYEDLVTAILEQACTRLKRPVGSSW